MGDSFTRFRRGPAWTVSRRLEIKTREDEISTLRLYSTHALNTEEGKEKSICIKLA